MDTTRELEYERTLMYGHYSELQQFAQEFAASRTRRAERRPHLPDVEEVRRRKSKAWRVWRWVNSKILPYVVDWVFVLVLGVLMAALSFGIDFLIEKIAEAHVVISLQLLSHSNAFLQYFFWVGFPVVFVLFSVTFVQVISVHAIGSGIPEMKTVLRGISLTNYLSLRTFFAKTVALIAAVGSSLPIGKEGPFVHISSIIAHFLSKFLTTINRVYANEAHSYELLAAACAVGVSCNFAAPIGGVLFSIEVTSTYFAVRNYWRGFFGAVCGAFLFRLAAVWFKDEETITVLFKTSFRPDFPFDPQELVAFAFIGIASGFGGSLFVYFHRKYVFIRRRFRHYTTFLERHLFIYPLVFTIIFTTLTFPLGLGKFMAGELNQRQAIDQLFSNQTWRDLPHPSEIGNLPEDSEQYQIVRQWGSPNIYVSLLIYIVFRFIFSAIAVTLPIPSGVFFPIFVVGAAFGRLIGELMSSWFPGGINGNFIAPGGYAVVGAAAMAGSVTHTISTSVIVFELTGQITHILPVMIAVLIGNAISSVLQPSIYDSIILIKGLAYLPDLKPNKFYNLYATDIMRQDLVYLSYHSTFLDLKRLLLESRHTSYPLVDAPSSRILIGSISYHNLVALLKEHLSGVEKHAQTIRDSQQQRSDAEDSVGNQEAPSSVSSERPSSPGNVDVLRRFSSAMPHSLSKIFSTSQDETDSRTMTALEEVGQEEDLEELRDQLLSQTIDFKTIQIDPAPFQLVERTDVYKIHSLFSILALSHAYVTSIGRLVGVVTLADLTAAIEGRKHPRPTGPATVMLEMLDVADSEPDH